MSTSDVQQLHDQYTSCLEFDIHDGGDDGDDDVDEIIKSSNVIPNKYHRRCGDPKRGTVLKHKMLI